LTTGPTLSSRRPSCLRRSARTPARHRQRQVTRAEAASRKTRRQDGESQARKIARHPFGRHAVAPEAGEGGL